MVGGSHINSNAKKYYSSNLPVMFHVKRTHYTHFTFGMNKHFPHVEMFIRVSISYLFTASAAACIALCVYSYTVLYPDSKFAV